MPANRNEFVSTVLTLMAETVLTFEGKVPRPRLIDVNARIGHAYRYVEKSPHQALVLKVARLTSCVTGAVTMLRVGLYQEQGALQRIIDDTNDDIFFISIGMLRGFEPLHERFFEAFWAEEFPDSTDTLARHERPDFPQRKKIRAYNARMGLGENANLSLVSDVGASLASAYSGFIHGASSQIMDMYVGQPPKFHGTGQLGLGRESSQLGDAANCIYRALFSFVLVARMFEDYVLRDALHDAARRFGDVFGLNELPPHLQSRV
ncbi:hypothetical protein GCM10007862_12340 [Dyella lipolytica]|uniref:Uncharacterized protein n=1 Tax=Dyella lipolytica TaxID=1867835 RepID=A0ABW8IU99_9GAMM|nr:hypothetical protein [Dyella lipolytica]GLQ46183.1 hypothetical protein GCM10007862_12340 [Dyella lipolytica]